MHLKRSKGQGTKHVKKKNNASTSPQIGPTSRINLEYYDMNKFCHTHYANHSKKTCPKFINSFKKMIHPWEPQEEDDEEE